MGTLQELGLTETEEKVYLALLDLGEGQAGEITRRSNVNRTNVYDALERLISKGLVSFVRETENKIFRAVNPRRLGEILEEKRKNLNDVMPALLERFNETQIEEGATVYRGTRGIKSIFNDILRTHETFYVYGAESRFRETMPAYNKFFEDERVRLGIHAKMLYNARVRAEKTRQGLKLISFRFLPKEYIFPSIVLIYGNKVATIVFGENPIGFVVESSRVVESHMNFFKILWGIARS